MTLRPVLIRGAIGIVIGGLPPVAFFIYLFRDRLSPAREARLQPNETAPRSGATAQPLLDSVSDRELEASYEIADAGSRRALAIIRSRTAGGSPLTSA